MKHNRKIKYVFSSALACALLLVLLPASALATHWSDSYVQAAADYGWIDDSIPVGEPITRGQFAVLLWNALGRPATQTGCPFTDVETGEVAAAVAALAELGSVEVPDTAYFEPDSTLTRQEGVTMLARAFDLTTEDADAAAGFADWAQVANWARDAMAAAVEKGLVHGVGGNRLAPAQDITWGEVVKLVVQAARITPTAIENVQAIGFVDTDGAKLSAIAVEYSTDLTGAALDTSMFDVYNYGMAQGDGACEIGSDPGKPIRVYINDRPEVSPTGGSGTGRYVIIEVNTDYQLASVCKKYQAAMAVGVRQTADIAADAGTVAASTRMVGNYTYQLVENVKPNGEVSLEEWYLAKDGTYTLANIADFQLFAKEDGTAFHATHCFEEATGEYVDVDLPYALYVPADYDPAQEYALVLQIHDAGFMGDDPMITLTEAQGCANFSSDAAQQIVKDQGLAGLIVVAPQICDSLRSTRDNWSLSAAVPATWQLLDYLTETYSIDMDRIYGTGQSMGGMQVVAMAAQRDNYFAGIWANGCQWGNNYDLSEEYEGAVYYEAPADGTLIWTVDADGNPCDYRNWYYMISDDNILITNCVGDAFSTKTWQELAYLYSDLARAEIPKATWNPLTLSKEEQNAIVEDLIAQDGDIGFYWTAFEGGNHMATWIYSHGVFAHYEWLLTQTREAEMERDKLPLDKPFVAAEEQIQTQERYIAPDADGNDVYFVTGEFGSGTADYNSSWLKMGNSVVKVPNWKFGE